MRIYRENFHHWIFALTLLFTCTSLTTPVSAQTCLPPHSSLTNWFPLDADGDDIVSGLMGNVDAAVNFVPGKVGNAAEYFGGTSGDIDVADHPTLDLDPTEPFSITLWLKADNYNPETDTLHVLAKRTVVGQANYLLAQDPTNDFHFNSPSAFDPTSRIVSSGEDLPIGTWVFVAVTYDPSITTLNLYLDGVLEGSDASYVLAEVNDAPLFIGSNGPCCGNFFDGLIDEVEIYNRTLSSEEIQGVFNADSAGKCQPDELISETVCSASNEICKAVHCGEAAGDQPDPLINVGEVIRCRVKLTVTNPSATVTWADAIVTDNFGAEQVQDVPPAPEDVECTEGTLQFQTKPGKSEKLSLTWNGFTVDPGETEMCEFVVATGVDPGGNQLYTECSYHEFNSGAVLKFSRVDEFGNPVKPRQGAFETGGVIASVLSADITTEDCDGDTLTDETELDLGTDPHLIDTDGDGCADNLDADPLNAGPDADDDGAVAGCDVNDNDPTVQ